MPEPFCTFSFPGIPDAISAEFTLGPGVTPSTCLVRLPALVKGIEPEPGELKITYANVTLKFPDCIPDTGTVEYGEGGYVASIRILDRRWKWAYGEVYGRYNFRRADDTVEKDTEKTPRELAKILFEAMGEPAPADKQIAALPDDTRPEREWHGDNPARALSDLCEELGCRVVLKLDNKTWICKNGDGKLLPDGGRAMNAGSGLQAKPRPDSITIICAPVKFQAKFKLKPMAEEINGTYVPLDAVSYKPAGGWAGQDLDFGDVTQFYKRGAVGAVVLGGLISEDDVPDDDEAAAAYSPCRDLAVRSVWRIYQIDTLAEGGLNPAGFGFLGVTKLKQLLPIDDTLVEKSLDGENVERFRHAYVEGTFYKGDVLDINSHPHTIYPGHFNINKEKGLVFFADPVTLMRDKTGFVITDDKGTFVTAGHDAAELYLVCSFNVRAGKEQTPYRANITRVLAGKKRKTGAYAVRHDEILPTVLIQYGGGVAASPKKVTGTITNDATVKKEANHYLDALEKEFKPVPSGDVQYAGIVAIEPDGAIEQVSFSSDKNGATTRASRNVAHSLYVPSWREIRRREKLAPIPGAIKEAVGVGFDLIKRLVTGKL